MWELGSTSLSASWAHDRTKRMALISNFRIPYTHRCNQGGYRGYSTPQALSIFLKAKNYKSNILLLSIKFTLHYFSLAQASPRGNYWLRLCSQIHFNEFRFSSCCNPESRKIFRPTLIKRLNYIKANSFASSLRKKKLQLGDNNIYMILINKMMFRNIRNAVRSSQNNFCGDQWATTYKFVFPIFDQFQYHNHPRELAEISFSWICKFKVGLHQVAPKLNG